MTGRVQLLAWRATVLVACGLILLVMLRLNWAPIADSWPFLLAALGRSWLLAASSILLGSVIAVPLALARTYGPAGVSYAAAGLIEGVRIIPELMIIFWLYFTLPLVTGAQITSWQAAIAALTVIAAAYLAEVIRAGLLSLPRSQIEAGAALGLTRWRVFRLVVLPQALANMVPAVVATLVGLFKSTSLVYSIGVIEFFRAVNITNNTLFAPYQLYMVLGVGYFVSCFAVTRAVRLFDPAARISA